MGYVAGMDAVQKVTTTSWSSVCSLAAIPTDLGRLITISKLHIIETN